MIAKMIAFDWLTMKKGMVISVLVAPVLILFFGVLNPIYMIPISVYVCFGLMPFEAEEKGNLQYLFLSMPVKRSDVVAGRFAFSFIMLIFALVLGSVFTAAVSFILANVGWFAFFPSPSISLGTYLTVSAFGYLLFSVLSILVFPMMFTLGYARGKYFMLAGYIPLMFVIVTLAAWDTSTAMFERRAESQSPVLRLIEYASENLVAVGLGLVAVATIIFLLSYMLSLRAFARRDF